MLKTRKCKNASPKSGHVVEHVFRVQCFESHYYSSVSEGQSEAVKSASQWYAWETLVLHSSQAICCSSTSVVSEWLKCQ